MNTNEKRNDLIEYQERTTIRRFIDDFKPFIKRLIKSKSFDSYDASLTAITATKAKNNAFKIEFKERNYSVEYLSGSTYLEHSKYLALKHLWKENPSIQYRYFNYCSNGYISYNLNKLFEDGIPKKHFQVLPATSYYTTKEKIKTIIELQFNPEYDKLSITE